jgi:hypothetical protein
MILATTWRFAKIALVMDLAGEGRGKADIINSLEGFVVQERGPDVDEADEEIVLDVLDALHGSCHPAAKLDIG